MHSKSATLRMKFDLDKAADTLSRNKILTKVNKFYVSATYHEDKLLLNTFSCFLRQTAQLGLLTKLEKAGYTLTSAKPLLLKAEELDAIGYLEASSDKVLPLVATAIELAPALIPLAGPLLNVPSTLLFAGAAASLGGAGAAVALIPDDSVTNIALQTALAIPLGTVLPGALVVGGTVLSKIEKK